ncbi:multi-sensor signal transduction histidine kinase [Thermoanaerobacterium thermosaccharolyticum DSM 571]|uniref:histidine kinase n=1 Tax=Thermoanaerobacterium thermosaccharolyticum (strain ATCC 7956 / DSM 571 / NCIMB 9385 / NCA 3814 / NCTC 13789 / WDCM 00135 / 2032) TaxID=580327 RepID=D9TLV9_THETC|nr:ATP-binding protein [Thermoanaerobacterium thermosaccharolyticum]ADL69457.1 multi-sensor signal transduction histidine kinase [Thermoanaerobacterium thermosaccharolyticum DSM 571]
MLKTLKGKISVVYLGLVLLVVIIGTISGINLYYLSKTIDGLMIDNYKSIKAVNLMNEEIDNQNNAILTYIYQDRQAGIKQFNQDSSAFYDWYNVEANNITEKNEGKYVEEIKNAYVDFTTSFSSLQEIPVSDNSSMLYYYKTKIKPNFDHIKDLLNGLAQLNETAMFEKKTNATMDAKNSMYAILIITFIAAIFGFIISMVFTNRFLKPMEYLISSIRKVKEGDLDQIISITTDDELGKLATEFNNMIKRLKQYEESQLGKIMDERNKTLSIVKSISDPLLVLNSDYKIILLNSAAEELFGIEEKNAVNKHFLLSVKDEKLFEEINSIVDSNFVNNKIEQIKYSNKYYDVTISPIENYKSEISDILLVFHNITEFKELDQVKDDFISIISHEFKTPLTSIMMGTSIILEEKIGTINEKQKSTLLAIEEEGEKLTELVNELIELTKIESGKEVYNFKCCSMFGIVENTIKPLYNIASDKGVNLSHSVDEDLPCVYADPEKISWVLNNLITNALKYTDAGDDISISASIDNNMMQISVKDTGVGIPKEYKDKIFDKFFHTKNGDDFEIKGTGLGLAVVKEIVEAHGGKVWCESDLDVGSNFMFTLPICH